MLFPEMAHVPVTSGLPKLQHPKRLLSIKELKPGMTVGYIEILQPSKGNGLFATLLPGGIQSASKIGRSPSEQSHGDQTEKLLKPSHGFLPHWCGEVVVASDEGIGVVANKGIDYEAQPELVELYLDEEPNRLPELPEPYRLRLSLAYAGLSSLLNPRKLHQHYSVALVEASDPFENFIIT